MKTWVKTFGCRVNQAEGDALKASLHAAGSCEVEGFENADLCVVNTCTVTAEADREALALVRRISRRNPAARLVVTGCLATRDPERVRAAAPGVVVIGNDGKASIPAMLGCAPAPAEAGLPALTGRSRAFLKVQDGCNMDCAYCTIPAVRPELSSVPISDILAQAKRSISAGVPELVLCGIRLGRYLWREPGQPRVDLPALIQRLLDLPGDFRVRLSSLEVTDATDRLLALMTSSDGRLCPSLHVPLQSGSETVLRRMRRWYSADFYRRRVDAYRKIVPHGSLFTDIMVSFPGETVDEHLASLEFARSIKFDGLHVFPYSARPGTQAERWTTPSVDVRQKRLSDWRAADAHGRQAHAARAVGHDRVVAPELSGRVGLTEDFLSVTLNANPGLGLSRVRVTAVGSAELLGTAVAA